MRGTGALAFSEFAGWHGEVSPEVKGAWSLFQEHRKGGLLSFLSAGR